MARSNIARSRSETKSKLTKRIVGSAEKLWGEIVKQGMLDLKKTSRRAAYDRLFEQDVAKSLFPWELKQSESLARRLKGSDVGPEALLNAVMDASEPFKHMLSDIMEMLVAAKAPAAAKSVDIEFNFDKAKPEYRATFEEFRATADRWETVIVRQRQLSADWLWAVAGGGLEFLPRSEGEGPLKPWLKSDGFDPPPPLPRSGQPEFDGAASSLRDIVGIFLDYCRSRYADRLAVGGAQPKDDVLRAAHDRWHQTVMGRLARIAEEISALPAGEAQATSAKWSTIIRTYLAQLPETMVSQEQKVQALLDLLRLPLWGKRAEMYSVWVAARLTKALDSHVRFDAPGGYLHFGFRATRIASISFQGHDLEYWTELRTPFTPSGKSKRKTGVQPDHRIVRATKSKVPVTVLCVECKHYTASSVSNFAGAANDYARACPEALVQLVSHGPMLPSVRHAIDPQVNGRVELQGKFRGGDADAIAEFNQVMLTGLAARCPPTSGALVGSIEVTWDAPLVDVDLHVRIGGTHEEEICFKNPGRLDAAPFAKLEQDVKTAPGKERVAISRWIPTTSYTVWVHDFTGTGIGVVTGNVEVTIVVGSQRRVLKPSPKRSAARAWHAASIYPDADEIHVIDTLADTYESVFLDGA